MADPWISLRSYYPPDDKSKFYSHLTSFGEEVHCWKAHHRETLETHMIKAIRQSQIAQIDEEREKFYKIKMVVKGNDNLMQLFELICPEGGDWLFYVMEYCEGGDLGYHLKQRNGKGLPEDKCLHIMSNIFKGLLWLHNKDAVHLDLKPPNIFLLKDGTTKIGDYGELKLNYLITTITTIGTPPYWAPEMVSSKKEDKKKRGPKSDIYSAGVILCQLFTGDPTICVRGIGNRKCPSNIPSKYWKAVLRATERDPEERFDSITDFAKELGLGGYDDKSNKHYQS